MSHSKLAAILFASSFAFSAHAQQWMQLMQDDNANFYDVQAAFNAQAPLRDDGPGESDEIFKRWEWLMEPRVYPTGELPDPAVFAKAVKDMRAMEHRQGAKSNANWTPIGPYDWLNGINGYNPGNGRVNCVFVDPIDATRIYVGTPGGGLWRSTDNGQTWSALFTDQPTLGVSGIAIDPTNTNIIYCATGDGDGVSTYSMGVIKSTDGGANWSPTGLSWTTTQARNMRALRMNPTDHNTLLCATSNGLWKTIDAGLNWTQVAQGSFHDVEYKPGDVNTVYACGDQFFRSTNGGDSFTQIISALPTSDLVNRMRIAVSAADPNKVYVLCGNSSDSGFLGLYRSNDSGLNFSLRSSSPNLFGYDDGGTDSGGQSGYDMAFTADPTNANNVFVGGVNVWESTDGGANWNILSHWYYDGFSEYTHADIHSLDVFNGSIYCGSDGGVHRSVNGGANWSDLSSGLQITQFYRMGGAEVDPLLIIAGAQDNGMNLRSAGQWTHVLGADGMEGAVDPSDPSILYGESQFGGINRSDDGGITFGYATSGITETGGWVTPFVIDPNQPNVLLAGFNNLWRTTDHGNNWTQWTNFVTPRTVRAIAIAPSASGTVYFANDNWMRRTTNGGSSWQLVSTGLPDAAISSIAVDPATPLTVYVALSGYSAGQKVFKSTNGGDTWTNMSINLPNVPANTIVCQSGTNGGVYVGTDIGVFYTDNTLSNWQLFSQGLPKVMVNELEINYGAGKLRAATYGRGLWESDLYAAPTVSPTAGIAFGNANICAGDAITFADASVGASPSWSWSFPGGTPPSSTSATPSVTYAASGNYTATLTVSNAFGTDQANVIVPVVLQPNRIDVTITLDNYPKETSWSINADEAIGTVASGGPYRGLEPGSVINEHVCVPAGCYTFTIDDVHGDGVCCLQGNGSYTVTNPVLGTIVSGGSFNYYESTPFCVSIGLGIAPLPNSSLLDVHPLDDEGAFSISLANESGPFTLRVIDALGRSVMTRDGIRALDNERVDLRHKAAGAYLLRVENDGKFWTARVVKP